MASQQRTSGGVRNLLAMFENREETSTSPPDRGRSPSESLGEGSNGVSPQPMSKVHTSFVAVERSGAMSSQPGLKKETNGESSTEIERLGSGADEKSDVKAASQKAVTSTVATDLDQKKKAGANGVTIEPQTRQNKISTSDTIAKAPSKTLSQDAEKKLGDVKGKGKARESETQVDSEKMIVTAEQPLKSAPLEKSKASRVGVPNGLSPGGKVKSPNTAKTVEKPIAPKPTTKQPATLTIAKSPGPSKLSPPATNPSAAPKSLVIHSKPSTTGKSTERGASNPSISASVKYPVKDKGAHSETAPTKSPITGKASASTSTSMPTSKTNSKPTNPHATPSLGHKARPKSPARPVKLPSLTTAPTASSLSKTNGPPFVSHRRSMGSISVATGSKTLSRSPSRTSVSASTELRRKPSAIDKSRPALGRPSAPKLRDQPPRQSLPNRSAAPDESFLARMTRPTASSASKVHEKIVTPPRLKAAPRPLTQETGASRSFTEANRGSPVSKRVMPVTNEAKVLKSITEKSTASEAKAPPSTSEPSSTAAEAKPTTQSVDVVMNGNGSGSVLAAPKPELVKTPLGVAEKSVVPSEIQPTTPQKANEKNDITTTGPVSPEMKLPNGKHEVPDASLTKPDSSDMSGVVPMSIKDAAQSDKIEPATTKTASSEPKNDEKVSNGRAVAPVA